MKKYLISAAVVLVVLAVALAAFGQREGRETRRRGEGRMFERLSSEEAAKMRERWQNASEEERERMRARMRERFGGRGRRLGREEQLKAIKAIEEQLAKLKAGIEATTSEDFRRFRELSGEERTKLRERFAKAREERQKALQAIVAQVARLQGQMQPTAEGERLIIVNTGELKAIGELAVKEKAKETAQRLERISRARRGFGGRPSRPRPSTPPRPPGGREAPGREGRER